MTQHPNAALARKLSAGQDSAGNNPRSILRALRLALARAAGERLNLPLSVIGIKQAVRMQEDLTEVIADGWMLLHFAAGDRAAAVCIDAGCVSAIVQTQTIGEVMGGEPQPRPFTDTDAAMAAPLIEDLFTRTQGLVEAPPDIALFSGFEYASRAEDARALLLGLVNETYRVFDLTVDLAGGLRQGHLTLLLPELSEAEVDHSPEAVDAGISLGQASGVMRAELHAMICRMALPLSSFSELKAGDVLPLTGARLDRTEVQTIDRSRAAIGRLGQCGGMRAVRLNEHAPLPALADGLESGFLESRTGRPAEVSEVIPPEDADALPDTLLSADLMIPDEEELTLTDSHQMVSEISQLAGLSEHGEDGDLTGL
ncbi:flagellar motor switch protein FliM [Ruegeria sp.]|uniref:FliM/FliN family flagellar motor C-terminal domain-containing protein n=1 Tax=Ruegeria sp. TaxID=1879320 RepID=UPI002309D34F|nr:flagellar motor switch protein FliM [Ruegeria sp.]MDA7965490.1 FliM/FliN family flagellar motor switch protein [Ruegeria sp.]